VTPKWFYRIIELDMTGADVKVVRRKLGFLEDGPYDRAVQQKVMGMARKTNIKTEGEVNEDVAEALGESAANRSELTPEWFTREIGLWEEGEDVRSVRYLLGLGDNDNRLDPDAESAVKRFQSSRGLPTTGRVDLDTAREIGDM
jgi:peptidoglycan hydrolase-like protein with peptidoglycan-binding domain